MNINPRIWTARLAIAFAATSCATSRQEESHAGKPEHAKDHPPPRRSGKPQRGPEPRPAATGTPSAPSCPLPPAITPDMPAYKEGFLRRYDGGKGWEDFYNALLKDEDREGITFTEAFAYLQIFAAEGGMRKVKGRKASAVGGIMRRTLVVLKYDERPEVQDLKADLANVKTTSDLTPRQLVRLYVYDFNERLDQLPKGRASVEDIGSIHAATMLLDTLFRFGNKGGERILRNAVNAMHADIPGAEPVAETEKLTLPLFDAYSALARNPRTLPLLMATVAKERDAKIDANAKKMWRQPRKRNYISGEKTRTRELTFAAETAYRPECAVARLNQPGF